MWAGMPMVRKRLAFHRVCRVSSILVYSLVQIYCITHLQGIWFTPLYFSCIIFNLQFFQSLQPFVCDFFNVL